MTIKEFIVKPFISDDARTTRRRTYSSIWAVAIGIIFSAFFYGFLNSDAEESANPILFIKEVFTVPFGTQNRKTDFTIFLLIFSFIGLAVAFSFKSGYFNIGASGQMLLPAIIVFSVAIKYRIEVFSVSFLAVAMIIFIFGGALIGALAGFFKAYFKIHEVISTIFLNYIITYIALYLFKRTNHVFFSPGEDPSIVNTFLDNSTGTATFLISDSTRFIFIVIGIVVLLSLCFGLFFINKKTKMGYKIRMIGTNPTNGEYVGVDQKLLTLLVLGFSGALSGLGGFFYFVIKYKNIGHEIGTGPIQIGFESIAIALLALNSSIGVIFSGAFYAILKTAEPILQTTDEIAPVKSEFFQLITGVIIFMSALALMLYYFRPIDYLTKNMLTIASRDGRTKYINYKKAKYKFIVANLGHLVNLFFNNISLQINYIFEKKRLDKEVYAIMKKASQVDQVEKSEQASKDLKNQLYNEVAAKRREFNIKKESSGIHDYREFKSKWTSHLKILKKDYNAFKNNKLDNFRIKLLGVKEGAENGSL
ncbi:ABC transporter permease [Mycoplasma sp. Ms02]|uniref:ABC transporter permease n=1 Tax=Mycoplasma sp. Ms02 TaxID=353851 RepID=UPI001C8A829E|nr:ABC transporter permease [Mycoplasma sp. Ms02]QZE12286.1 ABC transporter permease [Mycoplasma sp. Ms02]